MKMTLTCILGADPGLSGAVAFFFAEHPELIAVEDVPTVDGSIDVATLTMRIRQMSPDIAIIERVAAMPKQGVASTFKFGASYGALLGVIGALGIPSQLVTPTKWKRHFNLDADKEKARALALRLWPARAELFGRKRDHGRAEAALLARWGAENWKGGQS
jgi:crossover junction endodeoxyribonuclease RuvC